MDTFKRKSFIGERFKKYQTVIIIIYCYPFPNLPTPPPTLQSEWVILIFNNVVKLLIFTIGKWYIFCDSPIPSKWIAVYCFNDLFKLFPYPVIIMWWTCSVWKGTIHNNINSHILYYKEGFFFPGWGQVLTYHIYQHDGFLKKGNAMIWELD